MIRAERLRHESDPNKIKAEISDRKRGLLFMAAIMLVGVCFADPIPVEYNPEGSPIPVSEMEEAIQYHLWVLTSRLDLDTEYVGLTGADKTMGRITVQWGDLPRKSATEVLYGYTEWHFFDFAGPDVMVRVVLDRGLAKLDWEKSGKKMGVCLRETLQHELIHAFQGHILGDPGRTDGGHSPDPRDLMHGDRGECRYSPSLNDLSMLRKPIKSCHVELTPDGDLEVLDYNGSRISLMPWSLNAWAWGSIYQNPSPKDCSGVRVAQGEVWAEIKSFNSAPTVLRLRPENGLYRSIPFNN